jgi:hypothetical protein
MIPSHNLWADQPTILGVGPGIRSLGHGLSIDLVDAVCRNQGVNSYSYCPIGCLKQEVVRFPHNILINLMVIKVVQNWRNRKSFTGSLVSSYIARRCQ